MLPGLKGGFYFTVQLTLAAVSRLAVETPQLLSQQIKLVRAITLRLSWELGIQRCLIQGHLPAWWLKFPPLVKSESNHIISFTLHKLLLLPPLPPFVFRSPPISGCGCHGNIRLALPGLLSSSAAPLITQQRPVSVQARSSTLIHCICSTVFWGGGRTSVWMGNVPDTVKHCLSYEQLVQDYPRLSRWLLEEKVGVAFLAAAAAAYLVHMLCHMTSLWQRLQQPSTDAACCLCNSQANACSNVLRTTRIEIFMQLLSTVIGSGLVCGTLCAIFDQNNFFYIEIFTEMCLIFTFYKGQGAVDTSPTGLYLVFYLIFTQ